MLCWKHEGVITCCVTNKIITYLIIILVVRKIVSVLVYVDSKLMTILVREKITLYVALSNSWCLSTIMVQNKYPKIRLC